MEAKFDSHGPKNERGTGALGAADFMSRYSHDQQRIILHNLEVLSASAQFAGQDFQMKVLLNTPGGGWHWNFERNEVRVDPETLLNDPIDVSKAIYIHEGLHRRITPKDGVPPAEWEEPGLPLLVNSIEDPRIENFGGDAYPAYRPIRDLSYRHHDEKAREAAHEKLGRKTPRHVAAGLELIRQWFREAQGKPVEIAPSLQPEVKAFLEKALSHAQDAWARYPTRTEVDWEPEKIKLYFKDAYTIIRNKVWPHFKELYEQDKSDQTLDEAMRGLQGHGKGGSGTGQTQAGSKEPLSEQEVRDLLKAAKEGKLAMGKGNPDAARPLDLSKISLELRKELEEFLKSLPESTREDLEKRGAARLKEASDAAAAALEGKAGRDAPDNKSGLGTKGEATLQPSVAPESLADLDASALRRHVSITPDGTEGIRREFDRILNQDRGPYDNTVRENAATINHLESELRAIFHKRRQSHRESGRRSGPTLNINRFINERTSGKHPVESRAFEQKTRPLEKDYAVMILVDVSGSMQDKIQHAFAAAVACTEAFSSLNIEHSIWGFNEHLYPYKKFDEKTDPAKICSMEADVHSDAAQWNDDGWALTEVVKKLRARSERELILIVLSDGEPFPSSAHAGAQFKLNKVTRHIESDGKIRLIGLGMGQGTDHVKNFYRNSRANIPIDGLPGELSEVIRDAISGENKG